MHSYCDKMKQVVRYIPIDEYYQEFTETYIGSTPDEVDDIRWETEEYIARNHASLRMIYETEVLFDDTNRYF